jgi:hypothetical protein
MRIEPVRPPDIELFDVILTRSACRVAITTTARGVLGQLNRGKLAGNLPFRFISFKADHGSSQSSLEILYRAIYDDDGSQIDLLPSSPQGENGPERNHTTTQPGALFNDKVRDDHDNTACAVDVCAIDTHVPFSDGTVFHNEEAPVEPPFLPQSFFDVGPYDLQMSPNDGFTSCPQSVDDRCQSPFLPPRFFDLGPYDIQGVGDEGFASPPGTSEACTNGSGLQSGLFDMGSCDI